MKVTIAWNVWNNYLDTAIASEVFRLENERHKTFEAIDLVSLGGYPEPPCAEHARYLDEHIFVNTPEVPLLKVHKKFIGVFRVIEGMKTAFERAKRNGSDFLVVTNGDAWFLSLQKLRALLEREDVAKAAFSARVGLVTGLKLNYGACAPLFDDHFMIFNVKECAEGKVFDYDHSARFFHTHFGELGGIHNIMCCFADQRVPEGKFNIYTHCEDAVGQYGEPCGWVMLPWQYQPSTGFLHANCAQIPALDNLRSAFMHDLGFTRYPITKAYYEANPPDRSKLAVRDGLPVNRKPLKRKISDNLYLLLDGLSVAVLDKVLAKPYQKDARAKEYFKLYRKVRPARLLG